MFGARRSSVESAGGQTPRANYKTGGGSKEISQKTYHRCHHHKEHVLQRHESWQASYTLQTMPPNLSCEKHDIDQFVSLNSFHLFWSCPHRWCSLSQRRSRPWTGRHGSSWLTSSSTAWSPCLISPRFLRNYLISEVAFANSPDWPLNEVYCLTCIHQS